MSSWQVPLMTRRVEQLMHVKSVGTETSPAGLAWKEGCRLRCGARHECVSKLRDSSVKALVLLLKDILNQHVDILSDNKPQFCEKCHMTLHQDVDFRAHLRLHSTEKLFVCDICKLTFSCDSDFKTHLTTHTNKISQTCEICKKTFSRSDTLKRHLRIHTKENPYSCEICNKAFSRTSNLKTHLRIHTKEKPHVCELCKKAFSQRFSLKEHFRVHTKESSLAVLNHKIFEANSQVQNVKLGGHQTCLSINRLWHELCDMLRRLVGTTAPGHHDCSIKK
ncbi:zinc finger protein 227 [Trichonephila clavipes]|nr:zinc finger protein 227 [Trichonephila clavipes]